MDVVAFGSVKSVNAVQFSKAESPIKVTPSGMAISFNELHLENAARSIL